MKFSIVIPAHNEEGHIANTVIAIKQEFESANIKNIEILVVNDHSQDKTYDIVQELNEQDERIRVVNNQGRGGYGFAVRCGLANFTGDAVVIAMADASDDPRDMVKYYKGLSRGVDCMFGTRFCKQAKAYDYPLFKRILNRFGNWLIAIMFGIRYNDVSNAFKAYKREVIEGVGPILSCHFNLTVELPLKAVVRGYSYKIIPTNWYNREKGVSKWKIKEMGSRYMFIMLYVFLEKYLSRGDYKRR